MSTWALGGWWLKCPCLSMLGGWVVENGQNLVTLVIEWPPMGIKCGKRGLLWDQQYFDSTLKVNLWYYSNILQAPSYNKKIEQTKLLIWIWLSFLVSEFSTLNLSWLNLILGDFPDFRLKGFWQRIWKYESQVIWLISDLNTSFEKTFLQSQ